MKLTQQPSVKETKKLFNVPMPKIFHESMRKITVWIEEIQEAIKNLGILDERERIQYPPLVEICEYDNGSKIYDIDYRSIPGSSSKVITADGLFKNAEERGEISLEETPTLIYGSSGNSAIWMAKIAREKGYNVVAVMPDTASTPRLHALVALGAEIYLVPGELGVPGFLKRGEELENEIPGSKFLNQTVSADNYKSFYQQGRRTARKLLWDKQKMTHVVASMGTGGTLTGMIEGAKSLVPECQGIGVEVAEKSLLQEKYPDRVYHLETQTVQPHIENDTYWLESYEGTSQVPGVSANVESQNLIRSFESGQSLVAAPSNEVVHKATRYLAREHQQFAGPSTGAAFAVAMNIAQEEPDARIVIPICDSGERYEGELWHKSKRQTVERNITDEIIGSFIIVEDQVHQDQTTPHMRTKEIGGPFSTASMFDVMEMVCHDLERELNFITIKDDSVGMGTEDKLLHCAYVPAGSKIKTTATITGFIEKGEKKFITYKNEVYAQNIKGDWILAGSTVQRRCVMDVVAFREKRLQEFEESRL